MLHGTLIAPDESQFAVSSSKFAAGGSEGGNFVVIPDAHLLFNCEFKRVGNDLKLIGEDGTTHTVRDYFKTDKHPALVTPEGAQIPAAMIDALAGHQQVAQAGAQPGAAEAIGKVATIAGNCQIVRNGVAVTVNAGDVVLKNDVLRTGGDGALGVTFNDGTTFSLSANAQMSVNEYVYQDGGANNQALFNLVRGSISFFASQVAKTGDMKVVTPTATMGIRGTTVVVDIVVNTQSGAIGQVKIKLYADQNGNVGRVEVFSNTGAPLGTLTATATGFVITPAGAQPNVAQEQVNQQEAARDLALLQVLFNSTNIGNQLLQQQGGPNDNPQPNSTPGTNGSNGSSTNPSVIITVDETQTGPGTTTTTVTGVTINPPANTGGDGGGTGGTTPDPTPTVVEVEDVPTVTTLTFGDGDDSITGNAGPDIIFAGGGNDTIEAGAGDDQVYGQGGDDIIIAGEGAGNDLYDGGAGNDTITFTSTTLGVTVNLAAGTASGFEIGNDTLVSIENATGGSGGDVLIGTSGANVLKGMGGHDEIDGGGGADSMEGGDGNDLILVRDDAAWFADGGDGIDILRLVGGFDIFDGEGEGPHAQNIEIVDLNTTGDNEVDFDAQGLAEMNDEGVVRILGGQGDTVHISDGFEGHPNGYWRLAGEGVEWEGGDTLTAGVAFNKFEFVDVVGDVETVLATAYVQQGIETNIDLDTEVPEGIVGYYEISGGYAAGYLDDPIIAVGLDAVPVQNLTQGELDSVGILFITNESNSGYDQEFLNAQSRIANFVQSGGILILHDRFVENAEYVLPGGEGIDIDRAFDPGSQIQIEDDGGPIANGPGGHITDASLDGGNYSDHGHADRDTLPEGAIVLLTTNNPDQVVTFAYQYGSGWVIYSTIPLDFYLTGGGGLAASMGIYIENLLAWAAGLQDDEPANLAPTTDDVSAQGGEDAQAITVALSGSDTDGAVTSFKITSLPSDGTLSIEFSGGLSAVSLNQTVDASAHLVFQPNGNWNGETSFTYAAIDDDGTEDDTPATATITVDPVNDAPDAGDVTLQANLLGNGGFDLDPDFFQWTVNTATSGTNWVYFSTAIVDRSGEIFAGDDAVAVLSFSGEVPVAGGTGFGPSIVSDAFTGVAGDTIRFIYQLSAGNNSGSGDFGTVTGHIRDAETGDILQTIYNSAPLSSSTGMQEFNVALEYSGEFTIDFVVGSIDSTFGHVIGAELALGFAGILREGVSEDATMTFAQADFLVNSSDVEGNSLFISSVSTTSALGAVVLLNPDGTVTYDPTAAHDIQALEAGETATDTFTFTISDGHGGFDTATANLTVVGADDPNTAPETQDVSAQGDEDAYSISIPLAGSDADGSVTSFHIASLPDDGTLYIESSGGFSEVGLGQIIGASDHLVFRPDADWSGETSFTYAAIDSDEAQDQTDATATITVHAVNDAPSIDPASLAAIDEDAPDPAGATVATLFEGKFHDVDDGASLAGIAVSGNDADPQTEGYWQYWCEGANAWLDIGLVSPSTALVLESGTLIRFLPAPDFNGTPTPLLVHALDDTYEGAFTYAIEGGGQAERILVDATNNGGPTAISGNAAEIGTTVIAEGPAVVTATVPTENGFDMSSVVPGLIEAEVTDIGPDDYGISLYHQGSYYQIDTKGLSFTGGVENELRLTGGCITGIHIFDGENETLFEATGFDISAGTLQDAVDLYDTEGDPSQFAALFDPYAYSITGGAGPDMLGGSLFDDTIDGGGGPDGMEGEGGNDIFIVRDGTAWIVNGGEGVDTLRFAGAFDILSGNDSLYGGGPEVSGIEIIDLNEDAANTVDIDAQGVADMLVSSETGNLRVLGGDTDILNLTAGDGFAGSWLAGDTDVSFDGVDDYTDGVCFDEFFFTDGNSHLATIYVQHGITVNMPVLVA